MKLAVCILACAVLVSGLSIGTDAEIGGFETAGDGLEDKIEGLRMLLLELNGRFDTLQEALVNNGGGEAMNALVTDLLMDVNNLEMSVYSSLSSESTMISIAGNILGTLSDNMGENREAFKEFVIYLASTTLKYLGMEDVDIDSLLSRDSQYTRMMPPAPGTAEEGLNEIRARLQAISQVISSFGDDRQVVVIILSSIDNGLEMYYDVINQGMDFKQFVEDMLSYEDNNANTTPSTETTTNGFTTGDGTSTEATTEAGVGEGTTGSAGTTDSTGGEKRLMSILLQELAKKRKALRSELEVNSPLAGRNLNVAKTQKERSESEVNSPLAGRNLNAAKTQKERSELEVNSPLAGRNLNVIKTQKERAESGVNSPLAGRNLNVAKTQKDRSELDVNSLLAQRMLNVAKTQIERSEIGFNSPLARRNFNVAQKQKK